MYFGTGEAQFAQYSPISPTTNNDGVQGAGEIWWTNNGGQTWSKLLNNIDPTFAQGNQSKFICFQYVQKIVVATNGDTYVGTRSNGVMRLQNGGNNTTGYWYRVTGQTGALYPYTFVTDLEQAADGTFYAGIMIISTGNVSQAALFKSTTGAQGTWNMVTGYPLNNVTKWMNIACGSGNPSALYVLTASDLGGPINSPCGFLFGNGIEGFHKSLNGGSTWTSISLPVDVNTCVSYVGFPDQMTRLQAWYNLALAIHPTDNNKMYIGGINPFRTINGGISWQQVSEEDGQGGLPIIHPDQHTFVFNPSNPNIMYLGNDGGIYRSANAWVSPPTVPTIPSRRIDYNVTQLYSLAVHPTNWQLLTGSQDNGTLRFNGSGYQSTNIVLGGDGGYCFIDQNNPTFQIASYVNNYWYRSTNSGATFSAIPNSTGDGLFTNPADFDDINNILYSSSTQGYVARRTNITATPIVSYLALPDNYIASHVKVSPNTATNLYVGTMGQHLNSDASAYLPNIPKIYKISNANGAYSVVDISVNSNFLNATNISCIEVQPGDENHILVTFYNYGLNNPSIPINSQGNIWETTNGGTTWNRLDAGGIFPDIPVRWIIFAPSLTNANGINPDQALIATEAGVWSTANLNGTATSWGPSIDGLAKVRVDMLQVRSSDKSVFAATHGRGLFRTDAFCNIQVNFTANNPCNGAKVTFTDLSVGATTWSWDFQTDGVFDFYGQNPPPQCGADPHVTLTINGNISMTRTGFPIFNNNCASIECLGGGGGGTRLANPSLDTQISLYPNPTQSDAVLNVNLMEDKPISIRVFDAQIREVLELLLVENETNKGNL